MLKQKKKKREDLISKLDVSNIRTDFEKVKSREIDYTIEEQPATKVVKLKYKSCCGCGCDYQDISRVVPEDSRLEDGDIVEHLEDDDEWL